MKLFATGVFEEGSICPLALVGLFRVVSGSGALIARVLRIMLPLPWHQTREEWHSGAAVRGVYVPELILWRFPGCYPKARVAWALVHEFSRTSWLERDLRPIVGNLRTMRDEEGRPLNEAKP